MTGARSARRRCLAFVTMLVVVGGGDVASAENLSQRLGTFLPSVSQAFAQSVGRALPLIAASTPVSFVYDPETGAFDRRSTGVGQLYVEPTDTLGARHWSASLSYQRVRFTEFEGRDLDDLSDTAPLVAPDGHPLFILPHSSIDIVANEATAMLTYGLTDSIDVNLTVPVVYTTLDRQDEVVDFYTGTARRSESSVSASSAGIGDVYLRGKWAFLTERSFSLAAGLALRMPTANADDFHGIGSFGAAPMLYASTARWQPRSWLMLRGHWNGGFDFDAGNVSQSIGRWALGGDVGIGTRVFAALAVIGRHPFGRLAEPDALDLPRCTASIDVCVADPSTSPKADLPLFGWQGEREDHVDLSIGGRVHVVPDTVIVFANVLVPLTRRGLVAGPTPLVGIEVTY